MTSCADPHNGFADDVDTYTMHCAACWTLTLPSCMGIVAKGGMEV